MKIVILDADTGKRTGYLHVPGIIRSISTLDKSIFILFSTSTLITWSLADRDDKSCHHMVHSLASVSDYCPFTEVDRTPTPSIVTEEWRVGVYNGERINSLLNNK